MSFYYLILSNTKIHENRGLEEGCHITVRKLWQKEKEKRKGKERETTCSQAPALYLQSKSIANREG
jgi:hypothetical protein